MLRQTIATDGRLCVAGNIVETLMSSLIRTTANTTLDGQVTEDLELDLEEVSEMTRNSLRLDGRI